MNADLNRKESRGRSKRRGATAGFGGPEIAASPVILLRGYEREALENHTHGIEVWLWGRQTGKSFTLAAWAVDRLLRNPGRLVTILSNSRANGMELNLKCAEICQRLQQVFEQEDLSGDRAKGRFETMNYETRVTVNGRTGRIKVLPANARTARGFSGDLILDEFAFHEDSFAIWEAVEPILAAHPDYLCRVASTPNGRHNMFYRLATNPGIPLRKITRSEAWRQGLRIYHPITRAEITPDKARALALDKRAYDQNYECVFENENMALLTTSLISAAERESGGFICDQEWSDEAVRAIEGRRDERGRQGGALYAGVDVGRTHDLTVISVLEKEPGTHLLSVRGILRLRNMRLPDQQQRLSAICRLAQFRGAHIDMTGLGLGLFEYAQQQFGARIHGINFSSSILLSKENLALRNACNARNAQWARAPEVLATQLLQVYEERRIQHPIDQQLRDDLRKPERITTPSGRVSIAATRDGAGHADHFWSLALAVNAALSKPELFLHVVPRPGSSIRFQNGATGQGRARRRLERIPRKHLI